jgi:hypothetical protein
MTSHFLSCTFEHWIADIINLARKTDCTLDLNKIRQFLYSAACQSSMVRHQLSQVDERCNITDLSNVIAIMEKIIGECKFAILIELQEHFKVIRQNVNEMYETYDMFVDKFGAISKAKFMKLFAIEPEIVIAALDCYSAMQKNGTKHSELMYLIELTKSPKLARIFRTRHDLEVRFSEMNDSMCTIYSLMMGCSYLEFDQKQGDWPDMPMKEILMNLHYSQLYDLVYTYYDNVNSTSSWEGMTSTDLRDIEIIHSFLSDLADCLGWCTPINADTQKVDDIVVCTHQMMKDLELQTIFNRIQIGTRFIGKKYIQIGNDDWKWDDVLKWIRENRFFVMAVLWIEQIEHDDISHRQMNEVLMTFDPEGDANDEHVFAFVQNLVAIKEEGVTQEMWDDWADGEAGMDRWVAKEFDRLKNAGGFTPDIQRNFTRDATSDQDDQESVETEYEIVYDIADDREENVISPPSSPEPEPYDERDHWSYTPLITSLTSSLT